MDIAYVTVYAPAAVRHALLDLDVCICWCVYIQGRSPFTDTFLRHYLRHWNRPGKIRSLHRKYPHIHIKLACQGKPLFNMSKGGGIFFQSRNTIFPACVKGGRLPANARQHSPDATHEVNTQTPCIQSNIGGVVAVFMVRLVFSGCPSVEFAL